MHTAAFDRNPIGVEYDPDELVNRFNAGVPRRSSSFYDGPRRATQAPATHWLGRGGRRARPGRQLQPRLRVEVVLVDVAALIQSEEIILRRAELEERRPPLRFIRGLHAAAASARVVPAHPAQMVHAKPIPGRV